MRQWWKQGWAAAGVVLAVALAGAAAAQQGLFGEPRQFSDVPTEGFDYRRGVPTSDEDWHPVTSFSRYDEAVEYTARRGWFEGFPDGSFRPEAELTSGQLVKVIERAFPDGMTRAQAAAFLQYGEWGADLTPEEVIGEPRRFSDVPMGGFDYRRGVPMSDEDWHPVTSFSRYDEAVGYTARRGWFEGFPDGSFRPEAELTGGQLVRVIERAFSDGMTRAQAAAFLQYGEWGADLTPGRWETNPIPKGSPWRVGYWDITVRGARTAPDGDSSVRPSGHFPFTPREYHIVELEVVWRGSGTAPRFNLDTGLTFGLMDVGVCEVTPVLPDVTIGAQPGAPVVGNMCWQVYEGYSHNTLFFADLPGPGFYAPDLLNEFPDPYGQGGLLEDAALLTAPLPYWAWVSLE